MSDAMTLSSMAGSASIRCMIRDIAPKPPRFPVNTATRRSEFGLSSMGSVSPEW